MRLAGIGLLIYAVLTGGAGILGYLLQGSVLSALVGPFFAVLLAVVAAGLSRGFVWLYVAIGLVLFLGGFFGFQFILQGRFVPSGLMLIFSFLILGVLTVDLFLALRSDA